MTCTRPIEATATDRCKTPTPDAPARRHGLHRQWLGGAVLSACAALVAPALAQTTAAQQATPAARSSSGTSDGPSWASLTAPQRQALAPLAQDWAGIDAVRKAKWLEVAAKFPSMPADERGRVQERMKEWARLSPAERGRARLTFQEAQQLSPQERQARWQAYSSLPEDERKALADRNRTKIEKARPPASAPTTPLEASLPKRNVVDRPAATQLLVKPVAPTVVQAKPGATTTLMTQAASRPSHQEPGQPKISAKPGLVDRTTLLPKAGAQAPAPASAPSRP